MSEDWDQYAFHRTRSLPAIAMKPATGYNHRSFYNIPDYRRGDIPDYRRDDRAVNGDPASFRPPAAQPHQSRKRKSETHYTNEGHTPKETNSYLHPIKRKERTTDHPQFTGHIKQNPLFDDEDADNGNGSIAPYAGLQVPRDGYYQRPSLQRPHNQQQVASNRDHYGHGSKGPMESVYDYPEEDQQYRPDMERTDIRGISRNYRPDMEHNDVRGMSTKRKPDVRNVFAQSRPDMESNDTRGMSAPPRPTERSFARGMTTQNRSDTESNDVPVVATRHLPAIVRNDARGMSPQRRTDMERSDALDMPTQHRSDMERDDVRVTKEQQRSDSERINARDTTTQHRPDMERDDDCKISTSHGTDVERNDACESGLDTDTRHAFGIKMYFRVLSACFIIADLVTDWKQFSAWRGVKSQTYNTFMGVSALTSPQSDSYCSITLIGFYGLFCTLGILFSTYQLISMIGETLLEVNVERFKGFQIMHGWVESAIAVYCGEIPQAIFVLGFHCRKNYTEFMYAIMSGIIGNVKNELRKITCKQQKRQYESCTCEWKEWKYECVIPVTSKFYTLIVCGENVEGKEICCGIDSGDYKITESCCWKKAGGFFAEIKEDPKWAERFYKNGANFHRFLIFLTFIIKLLQFYKAV